MDDFRMDGSIEWLGTRYRTLLTTQATGGNVSVVDSLSPAGSGPPRHIHHDADETFVQLSGTIELWLEGETRICRAGEAAFIPRGKEHTFRVTDDGPARHLIILSPGGFENFFAEMAAGQFAIPDDMAQIETIAKANHLSFTGPPL